MSLIEMLTALGIGGAVAVGGVTSLARWTDRAKVESTTGAILNAYRRAQSVARAWARPTDIIVSQDSILIQSIADGDTMVVWRAPGPSALGVTLTPAYHVATFGSSGMASGPANVTHVLTRGPSRRQLVVSRVGRVRVTP